MSSNDTDDSKTNNEENEKDDSQSTSLSNESSETESAQLSGGENAETLAEMLDTSRGVLDFLNAWTSLSPDEHIEIFKKLPREQAEEIFLELSPKDQVEIYRVIREQERRSWVRMLAPDDAVDFIQELQEDEKRQALSLLDPQTRIEVSALAAYAEDDAGGLMNPRFARIRPDVTVEVAIRYLRVQTRTNVEIIYYAYVLDQQQHLKGVVSLRQLFAAPPHVTVEEIMVKNGDLVTIPAEMDQEEVSKLFENTQFVALPVVDQNGVMKGIVTIDDVVRVVKEEATEDIQKSGGMAALEAPYFKIGIFEMIKKRAGWLMMLFIGEMFTASAMGHYNDEIAKAVVLALFIPLIISSGGNSGSQASTLMVRAIALGEVRLRDWWRVLLNEALTGLVMGLILGAIGIMRIYLWPTSEEVFGPHYALISLAVGFSLIGIVLWGTICGSMLPFFLKRMGLDPAVASAPLVATIVDVTGIIIYFSVAHALLAGVLF